MTTTQRFATLEEWLAWLQTLHPKQIDMSLGRVVGVLKALGIARPPYQVITVGGTNGKGSCVALLEAVYRAAGYAVGTFTSPHLIRFNERIRFDGQDLDDAALVELFSLIDAARGELTLSYFEASAVAAMLHFARAGAEVGLLEVGMGGRLDAVNAYDADAALIVSIALDHIDYLGPDRDAIGYEKAGIVRAGRPVIVADPDPPAGLVNAISKRGAKPLYIGTDFRVAATAAGFRFESAGRPAREFPRPSFGVGVQLLNAAAVVATVDAMSNQLPVTEAAIASGLRQAQTRGRFEQHTIDAVEWIFDVAHNEAAAARLVEALTTLPPVARTVAVFGAMHDKDLRGVLTPLVAQVSQWQVGAVDSDRGAPPEAIAAILRDLGAADVVVHSDVAAAAAAARAAAADRVLVFGSFYTVGPAMQAVGLY